ncbi:MAG: hypothetical protein FJW38_20290 [Acidobacteria bacterium]|nr:hypothetical protein [Acidobacteriota bacterium]
MRITRFFFAPILAAFSALAADTALLNMIMADARFVAGIDIDRAKASPLGKKFMEELDKKDSDIGKMVAATGFDPRRDLREVVMASNDLNSKKGPGLVLMRGAFDASKIKAFINVTGAGKIENFNGVEMFSAPNQDNMSAAIVDPSLVVFGSSDTVKAAVQRKGAATAAMSAETFAQIRALSQSNDIWIVSTMPIAEMTKAIPSSGAPSTGGMGGMMNGDVFKGIQQAAFGVRFMAEAIELTAETVSQNEKDATAMADVIRFVSTMVQMNRDKPEMKGIATALDRMKLTTDARTTRLQIALPMNDMEKMFNSKQPAVKI